MTLRASSSADARSPELYAGCPQHVWLAGTMTSHPAASRSLIVANPMRGRIRSTRQVTKRPTCMFLRNLQKQKGGSWTLLLERLLKRYFAFVSFFAAALSL